MDISPIASAPVTPPNNSSVGEQGFVKAAPAVSGPVSTTAAVSKTTDTPQPASLDRLAQAVRQVNDAFDQSGKNLYASFEKDKVTGITVVKITDKTTKEVVRQLPLKEMIALAQSLDAQGKGGQLIHNIA